MSRSTPSARLRSGVDVAPLPAVLGLLGLLVTLVAALAVLPAAPAAAAAEQDEPKPPLRISLATLAPGTIPERGRVTLTGTVSNRSDEVWRNLNVYLLVSPTPLDSRRALVRAAASPAEAEVGVRRTDTGLFASVGDLAPGESVPYRLSLARRDLGISGEPGVYWVGAHVLGENDDGRDTVADGRVRTFMPLVPPAAEKAGAQVRTRLALVVPIKRPVRRGTAGRVINAEGWKRTLRSDGRLDRVLRLTGRAEQPLTWLVDPAVLDAARSLAQGNPGLDPSAGMAEKRDGKQDGKQGGKQDGKGGKPDGDDTGKQDGQPTDPSEQPADDAGAATQGEDPSGSGSGGGDGQGTEADTVAEAARTWLTEFRRQAPRHSVAALPYGDLDVAATLEAGRNQVYRRATALSDATLRDLGVLSASPVIAPGSGYLPVPALDRVDPRTPVLLDEAALPRAPGPVVARKGRAPVVRLDAEAAAGGPAPTAQYAALAVRQRLLSDAALHALSPDRADPLVVALPEFWEPGRDWITSRFFDGLDTPWLQLVDLTSVVATSSGFEPGSDTVVYPQEDRAAQLPPANLEQTQDLFGVGAQLDRLLSRVDGVERAVSRLALLGSSASFRSQPAQARARVLATSLYLNDQMRRVRVEGPSFVMMSGDAGPIQVTVVNGLEQTVRVALRFSSPGSDLRIASVDPVRLGPGQRTSVRLQARTRDIGVHALVVDVVDVSGQPLGSSTRFNVRSSNVSQVIWVVMAVGGGALALAIAIRVYRRVRRRKGSHGPVLARERVDV